MAGGRQKVICLKACDNWRTTKRLKNLLVLLMIVLVGCQPVTSPVTTPAPTSTLTPTETSIPQPSPSETATPVPTIPPSVVELEGAVVPLGFSLIKFADLYRPTSFA